MNSISITQIVIDFHINDSNQIQQFYSLKLQYPCNRNPKSRRNRPNEQFLTH